MRAYRRYERLAIPIAVVTITLAAAPPAAADVIVFNSNGFETPTFNTGNISSQQGFQVLPTPLAGVIQTGTVRSGSQAFEIIGAQLQSTSAMGYGDANFFYKSYSVAGAVNPAVSGNPIVRLSFDGRVSGALTLPSDIPFGGPYLEAYTAGGTQEALTPILLNINGGISVFTNTAVGGGDGTIATADGLIPRDTWANLEAQLNFSTQTFRVLLNGTPVTFTEGAFSGTNVPFRNTFGLAVSIAELGFQGYYNANNNPTFNSMYFDNLTVTAVSAVPEPSSFALAAFGLIGLAVRLRKRK
jgi:PEP-CTERM motif